MRKIHAPDDPRPAAHYTDLFKTFSRVAYLLLFVLLVGAPLARAQALDRIDVEMRENEADMIIRFVHSVVYLRHAPQTEAKLLRIFVRITDPFVREAELMQTTVRSPKQDRLPGMVAVYPELVNGILVTFSQKTTYTVRPGDDEKSVIVTVPLLPAPAPAPTTSTPNPVRIPSSPSSPKEEKAVASVLQPAQPTLSPEVPAPLAPATPAAEIPSSTPTVPTVPSVSLAEPTVLVAEPPTTPVAATATQQAPARTELPATSEREIPPRMLSAPPLLAMPPPMPAQATAQPITIPPPKLIITTSPPETQRTAEETPATEPLRQKSELVPPVLPADADKIEQEVELPRSVAASGKIAPMATAPMQMQTAVTARELDERARDLIGNARTALANQDPIKAIENLNDILRLPMNSQTEAAQSLIGQAREQNGEFVKAKAEYELYLKLYPTGPNSPAVRKHLAELPKDAATARTVQKPLPKEAGPAEWTFFSSVSSYYYTGNSQVDTLTPPAPGQIVANRATLSLVDQRSLITSLNLNARRRDAYSDTRIVVRDTRNDDHLDSTRSYNRLYSAYVDHNDRKYGYYIRAGRQNPNGMGVLERFDGAQAGYNLSPDWRVNAVYGDAVEFGSDYKKSFYGASIDFLPQTGRPGVSAYAIDQTLDGHANRRAVGTEARYFDGKISSFGMLDYDVLFNGVNIAMLQGNYVSDVGTNYYFVADHRRAPSYSLTNALPAGGGMTLDQMIGLQGLDAVRAQASALTAISDMYSVGFTHPVTEQWQLGADYRISAISSTQPVKAVVPLADIGVCLGTIDSVNNTCIIDTTGQNGSGWSQVFSVQAIGTNLVKPNAVGVFNGSYIDAPTYSGYLGTFSYMLPFSETWRLDSTFRYYMQTSNNGDILRRFNPSFKLSYQWQSSVFLEGEAGWENSTLTGLQRDEKTKRQYVYFGLRWDYR